MSSIHVALAAPGEGGGNYGSFLVGTIARRADLGNNGEILDGSGAGSVTTITAPRPGLVWRIAVPGTQNVWAAFGAAVVAGDAAAAKGFLLLAPGVYEFRAGSYQEKVAIRDA